MTRKINNGNVRPVTAAGVLADPVASPGIGYTLLANTTYHYELSGYNTTLFPVWTDPNSDHSPALQSAHLLFSTAACVITSVELMVANFEEILTHSAWTGEWMKENRSDAYVPVDGMTVLAATLAKAAGAVGAAFVHFSGSGASRTKLKVVVGATGGVARVGVTEKG